jgi:Zn-dependent protease/CBS domain-containing protein
MFGKRLRLFSLLGFDVHVDASWTILALLVTWSLAEGYFPTQITSQPRLAYWLMGAAGALGLFLSIVLHELSHSLVARHYGLPMKGITLFIFGGVAEMSDEPDSPRTEFRMAIVGPLASFAIALVCAGLAVVTAEAWEVAGAVLWYLAFINLALGVFNLVPAFPLDGGRVLRALLWSWRGSLAQATRMSSQVGTVFGLALIFFGAMRLITGNLIGGLWLMMIGLFIRNAANMSYEQLLMRRLLAHEPVHRLMHRDVVSVHPSTTLHDFVEDYVYAYHHRMFPVVEEGSLRGYVTLEEVRHLPRPEWDTRTVADVLQTCEPGDTIGPEDNAAEALAAMRRTRLQRLLVIDDGQLVGVLSARDILNHLTIRLEFEGSEGLGDGK